MCNVKAVTLKDKPTLSYYQFQQLPLALWSFLPLLRRNHQLSLRLTPQLAYTRNILPAS